jgi:hypothetical protein
MPEYRVFQLDDAGQIIGPARTMACDNDQCAVDEARKALNGSVLEIWSGPRRVALLGAKYDKPHV